MKKVYVVKWEKDTVIITSESGERSIQSSAKPSTEEIGNRAKEMVVDNFYLKGTGVVFEPPEKWGDSVILKCEVDDNKHF